MSKQGAKRGDTPLNAYALQWVGKVVMVGSDGPYLVEGVDVATGDSLIVTVKGTKFDTYASTGGNSHK